MGKPFSDLEKRAFVILANGGDPAASQDTELAKYWEWRINPSLESHDLPAVSERPNGRKLDDFAISPFGIDLPAGVFARATISQRSQEFAGEAVEAALGIQAIEAATTAYTLGRFRPAKVYARTGAADAPVPRTSRITGRKYKSYYAADKPGYTFPFGEKTAGDTVSDRQKAITSAIRTQTPSTDLITFSPEKSSQ